jgi:hypothetical protein
MTAPPHHVAALSGGKDARAKRITRWMNVYEDEHGRQWPGAPQSSRARADAVAPLWHGKRRRLYVLRISAPRGAVLVEGPWVPLLPSAPGARR